MSKSSGRVTYVQVVDLNRGCILFTEGTIREHVDTLFEILREKGIVSAIFSDLACFFVKKLSHNPSRPRGAWGMTKVSLEDLLSQLWDLLVQSSSWRDFSL